MTGPARGSALRQCRTMVRFERGARSGRKPPDMDVATVRRLLRTPKNMSEIADEIGVSQNQLRRFIKQRNICNLNERRRFIGLQNSLSTLEGK